MGAHFPWRRSHMIWGTCSPFSRQPACFAHQPCLLLPDGNHAFSNCSSSGTGRGPTSGRKAKISSSMRASSPSWDEESSEKILGFALKKERGRQGADGEDGEDSDNYADDIMAVQDDRIPAGQVGSHAHTRASGDFFTRPMDLSLLDARRVSGVAPDPTCWCVVDSCLPSVAYLCPDHCRGILHNQRTASSKRMGAEMGLQGATTQTYVALTKRTSAMTRTYLGRFQERSDVSLQRRGSSCQEWLIATRTS